MPNGFITPFTGQVYDSPYLIRIAELMRQAGADRAAGIQRAGDISAQMWGNLGQQIAGAGRDVAEMYRTAPQRQAAQDQAAMIALQRTQAERSERGTQALSELMRQQGTELQGPPPEGGAMETRDFMTTKGGATLWDTHKVEQFLGKIPGLDVPVLMQHVHQMNDAHLEEAKRGQEYQQSQANALARIAGATRATISEFVKHGVPIADAVTSVLDTIHPLLLANGRPAEQVNQMLAALKANPDRADAYLQQIEGLSTEKPVIIPREGTALTPSGNPFATGASRPPGTPTQETALVGAYAASLGKPGMALAELTPEEQAGYPAYRLGQTQRPPPPPHPPHSQPATFRYQGKDVEGDYIPGVEGQPGRYFYNGLEVTGKTEKVPAASVQVFNAANQALASLPSWALDDSRPSGTEANQLDPNVRMTPNGLYQAAQTWIQTGQFPPTGRGNDPAAQAVRAAISSKVGAIAASAGMDVPALRAFFNANKASLVQQQKSYDTVAGFIATADKNADLLITALGKIPDIGSPLLNRPLRFLDQKALGSVPMSEFKTYVQSVQNEYARIITAGPTLSAQLTDSARHEAQQLLDPNATTKQIIGSIQALKNEGASRLVSLGEQIQHIQSRMSGPVRPGGGGRTEAAATPAGRIRVIGPNGETGTVPIGTTLPEGWKEAR